jgi:hypothetical protein
MFRKPWYVVLPVVVGTVLALAVILWRYVRAGAGPAEVSSWFAVGGVTVAFVFVAINMTTAKTHLRNLALAAQGGVLSVAATDDLGVELGRRTESGSLGALPSVVSVTRAERGATFWEGGLDPIPLATIPWADVRSLELEHRSDVWLYPTSALVFTFREEDRPRLRLPLVSASLIGFGPISRRRAEKAFATLNGRPAPLPLARDKA